MSYTTGVDIDIRNLFISAIVHKMEVARRSIEQIFLGMPRRTSLSNATVKRVTDVEQRLNYDSSKIVGISDQINSNMIKL